MPRRATKAFLPLALAALAAFAATAPSRAQETPTDPGRTVKLSSAASGLPWASVVTRPAELGAWRGRPLDARNVFFRKDTWNGLAANATVAPDQPQMIIGFPMLPEASRGQLEQCAAGAFDANMRLVVQRMVDRGWGATATTPGTVIRLGWEMNRVDRSLFPWAAEGDGTTYQQCFRRWVDIFNPVQDGARQRRFVIAWNPANAGTFPHPIMNLWPGDDVVDIVASNFYDRCPTITTDAEWGRRVDLVDRWGNPAGPERWRLFAIERGKHWAVPEWGIGGSQTVCNNPGKDNPFFIRKMFEMFWGRKENVAFESYFNGSDSTTGTHELWRLDGTTPNPLSAAEYRKWW